MREVTISSDEKFENGLKILFFQVLVRNHHQTGRDDKSGVDLKASS